MRIRCPKCESYYNIPKEKLKDKGHFKARCKKCGYLMEIKLSQLYGDIEREVSPEEEKWYIVINNKKEGPFIYAQIEEKILTKVLNPDSYIWKRGFKGWEHLKNVEVFKDKLEEREKEEVEEKKPPEAMVGEVEKGVGEEEVEETQHMSLKEIEELETKMFAEALSAKETEEKPKEISLPEKKFEEEKKEEPKKKLLWERRETSVLFSLDEFKQRKKIKEVGEEVEERVGKPREGLIDIRALAHEKIREKEEKRLMDLKELESKEKQEDIGIISLKGADLKKLAPTVVRKRKNYWRVAALSLSFFVVIFIGIGIGAFIIIGTKEREERKKVIPEKIVKVEPPQPPLKSEEKVKEERAQPTQKVEEEVKKEEEIKPPVIAKEDVQNKKVKNITSSKIPKEEKKKVEMVKEVDISFRKEKPAVPDVNKLLSVIEKGDEGKTEDEFKKKEDRKIGSGETPEQLSLSQINNILRKYRGAVSKCFTDDMNIKGFITLNTTITIRSNGSVSSVKVSGGWQQAQPCIISVLNGIQFPSFRGEPMTVQYPFAFQK